MASHPNANDKPLNNDWRALSATGTAGVRKEASAQTAPSGESMVRHLSRMAGYDLDESKAIEADTELYTRIIGRLRTSGKLIAAEDVVGDLDAE